FRIFSSPWVLPCASVWFSPVGLLSAFQQPPSPAPPSTPPSALSSARSEPYDLRRKCATSYQLLGRDPGGDSSQDAVPSGAWRSPRRSPPSWIRGPQWQVRSGGRASVRSLVIRFVETSRKNRR